MSKSWLSQYKGYTYPRFLDHPLMQRIWRILFCRKGWHLWDEVLSGCGEEHYLSCDACEVTFGLEEE